MTSIARGIYKHYKGNLYLVFGTVQHTETGEVLVEYLPLYSYAKDGKTGKVVRPLSMFLEEVDTWTGRAADQFKTLPARSRAPRFTLEIAWE